LIFYFMQKCDFNFTLSNKNKPEQPPGQSHLFTPKHKLRCLFALYWIFMSKI